MRKLTLVVTASLLSIGATAALAKSKGREPTPAKRTCERASYPGDPVCDIGDGVGALPTPSSRGAQGSASSGYRVSDEVSVAGKSDFNANRYGGERFNNTNPNPRSQDVNGGGAVNYKF